MWSPCRTSLAVVVVATGVAVAACKGKDTPSPSGPSAIPPQLDSSCPPSSSPTNCAPTNSLGISLRVDSLNFAGGGQGPFSFTLAGLNFSGSGQAYYRIIGLSPGDYEVSAQMVASTLGFLIGSNPSNVAGGPVRNSIVSLAGPTTDQNVSFPGCEIRYFSQGASAANPVSVRFRFTMTGQGQPQGDPTACRGGP